MIDYAVLPPEINSARMYAGAGSAPMLGAAAAWDKLAATLTSTANSYRAVVSELTDSPWQGPSADAMAAAAEPYVDWMHATAAGAVATAEQARSAAAAYENAHGATVPPPVVTANRVELTTLVQTNVLGQNAAAIAANQADYSQMWAQDAAAMQVYAAHSAAAVPDPGTFTAAPQTANPAAAGTQTAITQAAAGQVAATQGSGIFGGLENALQNFLSSPGMTSNGITQVLNSPLIQGFYGLTGTLTPAINQFGLDGGFMNATLQVGTYNFPALGAMAAQYTWTALNPWSVGLTSSVSGGGAAPPMTLAGATGPSVSAGLGRATSLGGLSVPQAWGALPEGVRLTSASISAPGPAAPDPALMAPRSGLSGLPLVAGMGGASGGAAASAARSGTGSATAAGHGPPGAGDGGHRSSGAAQQVLSGRREELIKLRKSVAEMTMQRDALKRSAASVIRKAKQR